MIDYGMLPPEVNSGRLYAGPGAAPMLSAATAWDELAAELGTAASGYGSVISEMTAARWIGPSSVTMMAAVMPYVGWLDSAATLAEQTAGQARAAAGAYEVAHAMTVPPAVVLANRVLLATLIATNFFGQNSAAIAAAETQYLEMWAQDATAMYGYVASSATASELNPFPSPPNSTNSNGAASQTAAVAQATASNTSQPATATTSQLASGGTASPLLQQLSSAIAVGANPSPSSGLPWPLSWLPSPANNWLGLVPANYKTIFHDLLQQYFTLGIGNSGWSIGQQLTFGQGTTAGSGGAWYATPEFAHLGWGGHGGVTASTGRAVRVGRLSVPHDWHAETEEPPEEIEEIEEIEEFPPNWPFATAASSAATQGVPGAAAHAAGSAAGGNEVLGGVPTRFASRPGAGYIHKYGWRYSVVARPPAGG